MKKFAFLASVALAVPAVAQTSTSPASAPMAEPATAPAAETDATATETAPAAGTAPSAAPVAAPAPAAAPSDPKAILASEFPNYDKDKSGALDKTEMTTWLTALQEAQPAKTPLTPEQKTAWLNKSFADADADKNGTVNLAELQKHLIPAA